MSKLFGKIGGLFEKQKDCSHGDHKDCQQLSLPIYNHSCSATLIWLFLGRSNHQDFAKQN